MARKKIPKKVTKEVGLYIARLKKEKLPIDRVILFGSYARGKQNQYSDIDLCVVSPRFNHPMHAMQYLWSMRDTNAKLRIEPIGLHPKDLADQYDSLVTEIKRTGIELK